MYAVIFDVDGVLVDSEGMSCGAWLPVLERRGLEVRLAEIQDFIGRSDRAVLDHFRQLYPAADLGDGLIDEKEQEFFEAARGRLRAFPGLKRVLRRLEAGAVPMAVASSGRHRKIRFSLKTAGLEGFFDAVCSASDVARGKPAPDLFLRAAGLLGAEPGTCSVVEDSVPGIAAAKAAGMKALGFTSSHPAGVLLDAGADAVFSRYGELPDLLPGES